MDAGEALGELNRLSADIEHAAVLDRSGDVVAATPGADGARLARTATALLDAAALARPEKTVESVVVRLPAGAVFVVRAASHAAVATTRPEAPAALVVHDLRACLASVGSTTRRNGKPAHVDA